MPQTVTRLGLSWLTAWSWHPPLLPRAASRHLTKTRKPLHDPPFSAVGGECQPMPSKRIHEIDATLTECVQRRRTSRLLDNDLADVILTDRIDGLLKRRSRLMRGLPEFGDDDLELFAASTI